MSTTGKVVECFGRRVVVELAAGERRPAEIFGKKLQAVCGDEVTLDSQDKVTAVLPRHSLLARTDSRGRAELLVANISLLGVILTEQPPADAYIADRYLAGAALAGIKSMVLANKSDLARNEDFTRLLGEYRQAGYAVLDVSAHTGQGLEELQEVLKDETALLVGESGVGKSTLTNALMQGTAQAVRALSTATGEGRHTTVSAALFNLPNGGRLIDSPGVRDYAPAPVSDAQVQFGWPEIVARRDACRFNDCLHLREPACAVIKAVADGEIAARRYESYKRLLNLMRQLLPSYERR